MKPKADLVIAVGGPPPKGKGMESDGDDYGMREAGLGAMQALKSALDEGDYESAFDALKEAVMACDYGEESEEEE